MTRSWRVALLLLSACTVSASGLPWRENPAAADLLLAGESRPVLVYFTAEWCGPCRLLEREVFADPRHRDELEHFDLVRLDLDEPAGRALADSFRVSTVPTFVILDRDGAETERIRGYRSRRLLLRDLARFRAGHGTRGDLAARLAARPDDPALQAALGLRRYERLELDAAAELLTAGLRRPADLPDTLAAEAARALADVHRRRSDPAAGARVLARLLATKPDHAYPRVSWQLLATCRGEAGDERGAVDALREAAWVEPVRAPALVSFARAAAARRCELEAAETAARLAVAMTGRTDPAALAALADVLRRRRCYPEAMVWIKRAVAVAPDEGRWAEERDVIHRAAIRGE